MAFLLNKFCSRLAVYLGNYVILLLFSPSGPFHLALWEDSLVIFLTHTVVGNCYARHISGTPPALCSLFGSFWLLFHCVTCSHSPLIHAVYPSFTDMHTCRQEETDSGRWFPWCTLLPTVRDTHTLSLALTNEELAVLEKDIFSSIFGEWFANSVRRLK